MNHAVIIAAGTGSRMGQDTPKQFVNVRDRPVLVYTLLGFRAHPGIDAAIVVTLPSWIDGRGARGHGVRPGRVRRGA